MTHEETVREWFDAWLTRESAVIPEIFAQVADVNFQRAFGAVGGVQADPVQDYGFGDDLSGGLHEKLHDGKFRAGQLYRYSAHSELMGV